MMPNTNTVQLPTCVETMILGCCNDFEPFYEKPVRNKSVLAYADLMIVWFLLILSLFEQRSYHSESTMVRMESCLANRTILTDDAVDYFMTSAETC